MKKIVVLGGNNNCNIKWLEKMRLIYQKDYEISLLYYDNWVDNSNINFDIELKKLKELVNDFDEYFIVAKSAGAVLALIGIDMGIINPKGLVVMGVPLEFAKVKKIDLGYLLTSSAEKSEILVIQQKYDPIGKACDVRKILSDKIKFEVINGCHHTYAKYEDIKNIVDNFINL